MRKTIKRQMMWFSSCIQALLFFFGNVPWAIAVQSAGLEVWVSATSLVGSEIGLKGRSGKSCSPGIHPRFHRSIQTSSWSRSIQVMTVFCWISETSLSLKPRSNQTTRHRSISSRVELFSRRCLDGADVPSSKPLLVDG